MIVEESERKELRDSSGKIQPMKMPKSVGEEYSEDDPDCHMTDEACLFI